MRGTPIIVQLFIVFFGLPVLLKKVGINANNWNTIIFVIVTYGLNLSAFMSEIIRSAITGVDTGQKRSGLFGRDDKLANLSKNSGASSATYSDAELFQ